MRIKNWKKFQHFKDRRPPWIKLYRELLEDPDWHELDPPAAKLLVALWLIASEDETKEGCLPDIKKISFRLRIDIKTLTYQLSQLNHWLDDSDITLISSGYQVDTPETEKSREEKSVHQDERFDSFWSAYPKKKAKADALKAWNSAHINGEFDSVMSALEAQKRTEQFTKDGGKYIPFPASWIRSKRWLDEEVITPPANDPQAAWRAAIC